MAASIEFQIMWDDVIENSEDLRRIYSTNSTLDDFKPDDIVTCTYFKGFCKVTAIDKNKIELQPIDNIEEIIKIRPNYLRKVKVNDKLLKVLYENTRLKGRGLRSRT